MGVEIRLSDRQAQELAQLASASFDSGHRPEPCPICLLADRVLNELARADVFPDDPRAGGA